MQIVHAGRMDWGESLAAHRQGHMAHKVLFEGEEGSPDNFAWVMADEGADYFSPRHRHAWDQVRLCIKGSIPIGKGLRIDEGEVGYFPEGVPYGPQEGGPDRLTLVLQMGGASGLGYLSARQVRSARAELSGEGEFEAGVFRRRSGEGKKNLDAYEAIWRHATGKAIRYPRPRYKTPILIEPDGFSWREVKGFPGVKTKPLGSFPERGLALSFIRMEAGAVFRLPPTEERRLVFMRSGEGTTEGAPYEPFAALRIEPGEAAGFASKTDTELFMITLPLVAA